MSNSEIIGAPIMSRIWVMPSIWTFSMKPVQQIFERYDVGQGWVDPFAGENSPAQFTNDIEGRCAQSQMDALEFLKTVPPNSAKGVLFDPPYSVEQCLRRYTPKHGGTAGRAEYWGQCKNEIARIVQPGGIAISFCWDSCGIGKGRGFSIVEVLLLCHGACHNDTIVTVERKGAQDNVEIAHTSSNTGSQKFSPCGVCGSASAVSVLVSNGNNVCPECGRKLLAGA